MKLLITLILLCYTSLCSAETLIGTATHIYDGDTFVLQADNQYHRIRLASIDAPELNQPYGLEAKRALSKLLYNKPIIAQVIETDIYGRKVAIVYAENKNASYYMLEHGAAWHYGYFNIFSEEFGQYQKLEQNARKNRIGLWQQSNPTPPWLWRKRYKNHPFSASS